MDFEEIPDWVTLLNEWNKGNTTLARQDPKDYVPFPKEKENWDTQEKPVVKPSLYDRFIEPGVRVWKKHNKGFYEEGSKIPEELK